MYVCVQHNTTQLVAGFALRLHRRYRHTIITYDIILLTLLRML